MHNIPQSLYNDMAAAVSRRDLVLAEEVMSGVAEDVHDSVVLAIETLMDSLPPGPLERSEVWSIASTVEAYIINHYGRDDDDTVVTHPSGFTYRSSQINGDRIDCRECGLPLSDDFPILNDAHQYAYHEECLP